MEHERKVYYCSNCNRMVVEIFPNPDKEKTDISCYCGSTGADPYKMFVIDVSDKEIKSEDCIIIAEVFAKITNKSIREEIK